MWLQMLNGSTTLFKITIARQCGYPQSVHPPASVAHGRGARELIASDHSLGL